MDYHQNVANFCKICLATGPYLRPLNGYDHQSGDNVKLVEKLRQCVSEVLGQNEDSNSSQICTVCANNLSIFYEFRAICLRSETSLKGQQGSTCCQPNNGHKSGVSNGYSGSSNNSNNGQESENLIKTDSWYPSLKFLLNDDETDIIKEETNTDNYSWELNNTPGEKGPSILPELIKSGSCCRTCLSTQNSTIFTPLSTEDMDSIKFYQKLQQCVPELILDIVDITNSHQNHHRQNNYHPSIIYVICSNCLNRLKISFTFRTIALKSVARMRRNFNTAQPHLNGHHDDFRLAVLHPVYYGRPENGCQPSPPPPPPSAPHQYAASPPSAHHPQHHMYHQPNNYHQLPPPPLPPPSSAAPPIPPTASNWGMTAEISPFLCTLCGKRFGKKSYLRAHIKLHSDKKTFKCHLCHKLFLTSPYLQAHLRRHYKKKSYQCHVCNKLCYAKSELNLHMRTHTTPIPVPPAPSSVNHSDVEDDIDDMDDCSDVDNDCLSDDMMMTSYKCLECNQQFDDKLTYEAHTAVQLQCTECGRGFTFKCQLDAHTSIAHSSSGGNSVRHQQQRHVCPKCGKGFLQGRLLNLHVATTHASEKTHKCPTCGKWFTQTAYLQRHLKIHSTEKPFQCTVCQKTFPQKSRLQNHFRVHSGEKPYRCATCGRSFSQKHNLQRHATIHVVSSTTTATTTTTTTTTTTPSTANNTK